MELSKRWKDRRTERWFSDAVVEEEKIKKLCDVIPHIPSQQSIVDHYWCCFSKDEKEIRDFLFYHVFLSKKGFDRKHVDDDVLHFGSILTAPYVLVGLHRSGMPSHNDIGLHTGVLLATALELELDVATMGCQAGFVKLKKFNKLIRKHRNIPDKNHLVPVMAVWVGYKERLNKEYFYLEDGTRVNTQLSVDKDRKPNNFVGKHEQ